MAGIRLPKVYTKENHSIRTIIVSRQEEGGGNDLFNLAKVEFLAKCVHLIKK